MKDAILLIGTEKLSYSVATCLLRAGHSVTFVHPEPQTAEQAVRHHLEESILQMAPTGETGTLSVTENTAGDTKFAVVLLLTRDRIDDKVAAITIAKQHLASDGLLALNLESIELNEVQALVDFPERIVGLNWVEPAHTTFFLEIISNAQTSNEVTAYLEHLAPKWGKDAYVTQGGFSIRARLNAALMREALYLVANDYATHEDIDRNCRNDAGYYLPFAGNARYMDLMGTYAYGTVMKDLNPHLSRQLQLDPETAALTEKGNLGMESGKGFFNYSEEEAEEWERKMNSFSYQIHHLIKKYP